jgi:hypothetical protein
MEYSAAMNQLSRLEITKNDMRRKLRLRLSLTQFVWWGTVR